MSCGRISSWHVYAPGCVNAPSCVTVGKRSHDFQTRLPILDKAVIHTESVEGRNTDVLCLYEA
jgi:hypothetical protein